MQYLFLPQAQVNQTPPHTPLFASCGIQFREIINVMTIMMKTIKNRYCMQIKYLDLYKNVHENLGINMREF
jgi:hypothetical protein